VTRTFLEANRKDIVKFCAKAQALVDRHNNNNNNNSHHNQARVLRGPATKTHSKEYLQTVFSSVLLVLLAVVLVWVVKF
jgi:hypothetical protein